MKKENFEIEIETEIAVLGEICRDEEDCWVNLFGRVELEECTMCLTVYSQEHKLLEYVLYTEGEPQWVSIQLNDKFESEYTWISLCPFNEYENRIVTQ